MRSHLVLGTAGHIDHGKTALVRALTGQDGDRLPEEKARGITIELGFATLDLDLGRGGGASRLAVVDVPGHERFVRTMVAGASGLDLVLLVVAADEGVMPQTREHAALCALLGVEHGVVVLNKCDLADADVRALAEEEVRALLAGGPLARAPIVAASAATGEGLDAVREALARVVGALPPRAPDARPARLYVDRVFEKRGLGAIVTGTWSGRPCRVGQAISFEPGARRARIRGLERHGAPIDETASGARIALNVQGLAQGELHRGDLVCEPDALPATLAFDAALEWLAGEAAPGASISVELLTGTSERRARVAPLGDAPIGPGRPGFARLHVEGAPLRLLPGDRFAVRGFARDAGIGGTLGGGRVLDVDPPRLRRRDPALLLDLERLAGGDFDEGLLVRIERAGLAGKRAEDLALETGGDAAAIDAGLDRLARAGTVARLGAAGCLSSAAATRLEAGLLAAVDAFHASEPLQPGLPRATLLGRIPGNVSSAIASGLLARLAEAGALAIEEPHVRRTAFRARLDADQERLARAVVERLERAGLEAPALRTLAEELDADPARLRVVVHHLEREGRLVAAPEELFFARGSVVDLIGRVIAHFARTSVLDTQTLKQLVGASRRTAMPLMALLDELQITRRDGGLRRLLQREPRWSRGREGARAERAD